MNLAQEQIGEIRQNVKLAKDKKAQIAIEAQLNDVTVAEIKKILIDWDEVREMLNNGESLGAICKLTGAHHTMISAWMRQNYTSVNWLMV